MMTNKPLLERLLETAGEIKDPFARTFVQNIGANVRARGGAGDDRIYGSGGMNSDPRLQGGQSGRPNRMSGGAPGRAPERPARGPFRIGPTRQHLSG